MTYWLNIWRSSRPSQIGAEPVIQYWATEQQAIEEITDGMVCYYYDLTIRVGNGSAKMIYLEPPARKHDPKARRVNMPLETEAAE